MYADTSKHRPSTPRHSGYSFVLTCYSWSLAFFDRPQFTRSFFFKSCNIINMHCFGWPTSNWSVKKMSDFHRKKIMYLIYKVTYLQLSNLFLSTEAHWLDSIHQHKAGTSPRILRLSALQWRIRCRRTVWPQKRLKNKIIKWLLPDNYVWYGIILWTVNNGIL